MREFNLNASGPREMPRESFITLKRPPRKTANRSKNCQKSSIAERIRRYGIWNIPVQVSAPTSKKLPALNYDIRHSSQQVTTPSKPQ